MWFHNRYLGQSEALQTMDEWWWRKYWATCKRLARVVCFVPGMWKWLILLVCVLEDGRDLGNKWVPCPQPTQQLWHSLQNKALEFQSEVKENSHDNEIRICHTTEPIVDIDYTDMRPTMMLTSIFQIQIDWMAEWSSESRVWVTWRYALGRYPRNENSNRLELHPWSWVVQTKSQDLHSHQYVRWA